MKVKHIRICAALGTATFCSAVFAAAHIVDIAWSPDGRFVHNAQIAAGKFVGGVGLVHPRKPGGRKRATRAAPDCAFVRTPWRCLYHCGVAPRLRRQFLRGGL